MIILLRLLLLESRPENKYFRSCGLFSKSSNLTSGPAGVWPRPTPANRNLRTFKHGYKMEAR